MSLLRLESGSEAECLLKFSCMWGEGNFSLKEAKISLNLALKDLEVIDTVLFSHKFLILN